MPNGEIVLDACLGASGVDEGCTLVTDASACTTARCQKRVIVSSGGEMGCVTGHGYTKVIAGYAREGHAAVCINYFETATASGTVSYIVEATRIDTAVREATTGAWAQAYWTGDDLLLQGISHGATAAVILMARTTLDEQPHWQGSRFTAGCFFDGSYDQVATANLLRTGAVGGGPCVQPVSYTRGLERYCGPGTTETTCDLPAIPAVQDDTNTAVTPSSFAIFAFQMFECGSALRACIGDIIPGPPIEQLCQNMDGSADHGCRFVSLPYDSPLTCHRDHFDQCRTWFEERLAR